MQLRWHFVDRPQPILALQRKGLQNIAKQAAALIKALDALDGFGRWKLVEQLGMAEGLSFSTAIRNDENKRRIDEWHYLTAMIAASAAQPQSSPGRGRPRNEVAVWVLMDLAALFEHVTGRRAARRVPRTGEDAHRESGQFLEFARAVWPVIFRNGDEGLLSQLREWADHGSKPSILMRVIDLSRPEWGVIPA